ncbi:MAG: hypothetical protein AB1Z66_01830 [Candidatus Limnocylindrales bacterium]
MKGTVLLIRRFVLLLAAVAVIGTSSIAVAQDSIDTSGAYPDETVVAIAVPTHNLPEGWTNTDVYYYVKEDGNFRILHQPEPAIDAVRSEPIGNVTAVAAPVPYKVFDNRTLKTNSKVVNAWRAVGKWARKDNMGKVVKNLRTVVKQYDQYLAWMNANQPEGCYADDWAKSKKFAQRLRNLNAREANAVQSRNWRKASSLLKQSSKAYEQYAKWYKNHTTSCL